MKKLAVVVMMIAIATFMAAAMASADGHEWRTIQGRYAFTGSNLCLVAPGGFDSDPQSTSFLIANPPPAPGVPQSVIDLQTSEGTYTFERNGTGALHEVFHDIGAFPNAGGSGEIRWKFTYTVDEGKITFTSLIPGSYSGTWLTGPMAGSPIDFTWTGTTNGVISPDGKTINVTYGAPFILTAIGAPFPNLQIICNGSFVMFQVSDRDERK